MLWILFIVWKISVYEWNRLVFMIFVAMWAFLIQKQQIHKLSVHDFDNKCYGELWKRDIEDIVS